MDLLIGRVTHYFDKIGVAVVAIENQSLKLGDTVKFSGHDKEFTQQISSMQFENEQIPQVQKGQSVGIKTEKAVKTNDKVYLVG